MADRLAYVAVGMLRSVPQIGPAPTPDRTVPWSAALWIELGRLIAKGGVFATPEDLTNIEALTEKLKTIDRKET